MCKSLKLFSLVKYLKSNRVNFHNLIFCLSHRNRGIKVVKPKNHYSFPIKQIQYMRTVSSGNINYSCFYKYTFATASPSTYLTVLNAFLKN